MEARERADEGVRARDIEKSVMHYIVELCIGLRVLVVAETFVGHSEGP